MVIKEGIAPVKKELRNISQDEFDTAIAQWYPKMVKFAGNPIPFLDFDDKMQEAKLVLYKCLQRFESGHGAIFHTFFHRALWNTAGSLAHRPLKHNENPNKVTYLGELDNDGDDERSFLNVQRAIGVDFDTSLEFEVESWGFTGNEVPYIIGTVINHISIKETAALFGIEVDDLKAAKETAKEKIAELREVM